MTTVIEVGDSREFENGTMKEIQADGREILVARVGDKYYAVGNRCPHMGGRLSQGQLEGTVVTCPRHGSQFDLEDGRVRRWLKESGLLSAVGKALKSPRPLATYKVEVTDNRITVKI